MLLKRLILVVNCIHVLACIVLLYLAYQVFFLPPENLPELVTLKTWILVINGTILFSMLIKFILIKLNQKKVHPSD